MKSGVIGVTGGGACAMTAVAAKASPARIEIVRMDECVMGISLRAASPTRKARAGAESDIGTANGMETLTA
jgi:hypothetical protein